jgi:acyl-CoA dehydrogenase
MAIDFEIPPEAKAIRERVRQWVHDECIPAEKKLIDGADYKETLTALRQKARAQGLWCPFIPKEYGGMALGPLANALVQMELGESHLGALSMNTQGPDDATMLTLLTHGTEFQKEKFLKPLLNGEKRICYSMTEKAAGADATGMQTRAVKDGNENYVLNGEKWFSSAASSADIALVMAKTDPDAPRHQQQSMILVPRDTPGITIVRPLTVFGYDDAPHGHAEVEFKDVRVPIDNILLGEGRGFEIAQGRLGPGRIHHCMRMIGLAERSLEAMCARVKSRVAFGRPLADQGVIREWIADSRMEIEQARLLTLKAAYMMDTVGNKAAQAEIAMIKVVAPKMVLNVVDRAIQAHGGGGVSADFGLAYAWARARVMRIVDGPDEVHKRAVARIELRK